MNEENRSVTEIFEELCARLPHAEVVERMRTAISGTFAEHNIAMPDGVSILFDDTHGNIVLLSGTKVLDGELSAVANDIAQHTLRLLLLETASKSGTVSGTSTEVLTDIASTMSKWTSYFFWGFNSIVLFYWVAWFVNFVFSASFREWYDAASNSSDFGIQGILLLLIFPAIPLVSVVGALLARRGVLPRYSHERTLVRFEIPALVTAFVVNVTLANIPLTDGLRILLMVVYFATLIYWYIVTYHISTTTARASLLKLVTGSIAVTVIAYATFLFAVPMYLVMLEEVVPDLIENLDELLRNPMSAMIVLLTTIVTLIPALLIWVLGKHIAKTYRNVEVEFATHSRPFAMAILVGTPVLFVLLLVASSLQFSAEKYTQPLILLGQEEGGYVGQSARARELVSIKDDVDNALRNAMFAHEQYLFSKNDFSSNYGPKITNAYLRVVAFPFISKSNYSAYDMYYGNYGGSGNTYAVLSKGYKRAYGKDISTVNQRTVATRELVELLSRDVQVLTEGSPIFTTVSVTDSLSSFMPQDQEVVYEFSLPSHAVVTGLKLGAALEYTGIIAPRGAAEQTYVNQVRTQRDPALLEQVGPRQYRLRVYPIPGVFENAQRSRREKVEGPIQRVQITYLVARDAEGIPLPVYSNQFNVLLDDAEYSAQIDGRTARFAEGNAYIADPKDPKTLCALANGPTTSITGSERSATLYYAGDKKPNAPLLTLCDEERAKLTQIKGKSVAILVDTSFKNKDGASKAQLDQLRALPGEFFAQNTVRYYPFSETFGTGVDIKEAATLPRTSDIVYFGEGDIISALHAVDPGNNIIVVLAGENAPRADVQTVWQKNGMTGADLVFVHPKTSIPTYPSKFTALVTGARSVHVVADIKEALQYFSSEFSYATSMPHIGSFWYVEAPTPTLFAQPTSDLYSISSPSLVLPGSMQGERALQTVMLPAVTVATSIPVGGAERKLFAMVEHSNISELMKLYNAGADFASKKAFDILHERAKNIGIVTPLSSYIALVNDTQRQLLSNLSTHDDKYTSEQVFMVTQPTFTSPMRGSFGGGFGQSSLGLSGGVMVGGAPAAIPMMTPGSTGVVNNYENTISFGGTKKSVISGGDTPGDILIPRIALLLVVFLLLAIGVYGAYRFLKRTHAN